VALFGVAGILGFLVDAGVLYLLKDYLGLYVARVFSFASAVFVTWLFNRSITFSGRHSAYNLRQEFVAYFGLMLLGGCVNYGVYFWLVYSSEFVVSYPVVGVAVGSIAGMLVNLLTSKYFLFKHI